jgi:hypothetical protein
LPATASTSRTPPTMQSSQCRRPTSRRTIRSTIWLRSCWSSETRQKRSSTLSRIPADGHRRAAPRRQLFGAGL